jgi:hypothetical protein
MEALRIAAFVAIALIQNPAAPSDSPVGASSQASQPTTSQDISAKQYLDNAKQILSEVADESLPNDARKVFSQLRTNFDNLSSVYSASQAGADSKITNGEGEAPVWMNSFYDVERDLALLIGGGAMLSPSSASPLLNPQDVPDISILRQQDPSLSNRTVLERFRLQLELFFDATSRAR